MVTDVIRLSMEETGEDVVYPRGVRLRLYPSSQAHLP